MANQILKKSPKNRRVQLVRIFFYFGLERKILKSKNPENLENPGVGIGIIKPLKTPEKIPSKKYRKSQNPGLEIWSRDFYLRDSGFFKSRDFIPGIRDFFSLGIFIPRIRDFS